MSTRTRIYLFAICLSIVSALVPCQAVPTETTAPTIVYGYHLKPPFILDEDKAIGLYFDFSTYINHKVGRVALKTEYMPRKRLDKMVAEPAFNAIVIGINPLWFGDTEKRKFLWTVAWMHDRDEVVSRVERPIDYHGPDSLHGLVVGLPRGYYYYGIDEAATQGLLVREDSDTELQNLQKLQRGRIAVTVISRSNLTYLAKVENWHPDIYISPLPHDEFDRFILVSHKAEDVYKWLAPLV